MRSEEIGDEEFHLAFETDDFEAAHALHSEMGCICFENEKMGFYFIQDPDGYWLGIVPVRKYLFIRVAFREKKKNHKG